MILKDKQIGDNVYYVRPMPPKEALKLLGDLQAVVTGSLKVEGEGELLERDVSLGALLAGVGGKLTGDKLMGYSERLLREDYVSVRMPGEESPSRLGALKVEEIFTGHIKDMLALMWFVLEVNYGDFFGLLPEGFGTIGATARK